MGEGTSFIQLRILIGIIIFSAILTLSDVTGFLSWYKNARAIIGYPVQVTAKAISSVFNNSITGLLTADKISQENALLKQKILTLEDTVASMQQDADIALAIKQHPELFTKQAYKKTITSEVIDIAYNAVQGKVLLNKGSAAGVTAGSPVVIGNLYVGYITEVFPFSSVCTTISVPGQQMLASIPKRKITATLRTTLNAIDLIDLLASEQVQQDDSVYVFREGYSYTFLIGVISQAPANTGSAERVAKVFPTLHIEDISLVTIILQ